MNRIWERSNNKGSALLLLLAIADHAHDDGGGAYPSVRSLARKTRMSERATRLLIQRLVDSGEIEVQIGAGPKGVNLYRVNLEALMGAKIAGGSPAKIAGGGGQSLQGAKFAGVQSLPEGGAKFAGEGVQNPAAHIRKEPSCMNRHEPSLQQQQAGGSDGLPALPAAAAANDFNEGHLSVYSFADVEQFVIETKPHIRNPGGLARRLWRSGEEDAAIDRWLLQKAEPRRTQAGEYCAACSGTGWEIVTNETNQSRGARPCPNCRPGNGAA